MNLLIEKKLWAKGINFIAGVDEAGRGPLAGPVVAAVVLFDKNTLKNSFNKKINDSKKLSSKLRDELYTHILESANSVEVGVVTKNVIDKINILEATKQAMNIALQKLSINPEIVLVDGNFYKHPKYLITNLVKGDARSYIIAAASIVAKVTRDKIMIEYDKQFPQFGFAKHKGYGTALHIRNINEYGYSPLHRTSFHLQSKLISEKK
ncbi:MAG: ribonuclease HII [Ignavibacteria bacterium]|nr:ribonuclease HII [Bacteroidota bacterium]MSQ45559.1 ribonuclease HII [Ignavibacteria bacterium]